MSVSHIKLTCLSLSICLLSAAQSFAADVKPYINAGVGHFIEDDGIDFSTSLLRGGVEINRYLAFEAEGQTGFGTKERDQGGGDFTRGKFDYQFAVYAVGKAPITDAFSLHGRVGYGSAKRSFTFDRTFLNGNMSTTEYTSKVDGPILGVGAEYMFGKDRLNGIRFDTSILVDSNDENGIGGFALTYVRKF